MSMTKRVCCLLVAAMTALSLLGCKKTISISSEVPMFTEIAKVTEAGVEVETKAMEVPETTAGMIIEAAPEEAAEEMELEETQTTAEATQFSNSTKSAGTHSHKWKHSITAPTCTTAGYTTHTCSCGAKEVDSKVAAKGHTWGPWCTVTEATETTAGQAKKVCFSCKASESRVLDKLPSSHKHSYTSTVTKVSSCSIAGVKTFRCACGDSYTEEIAMLAHKYVDKTVAATCKLRGYTEYTCSVCGNRYLDKYTNVLAHAYNDTVTKPTCTAEGYTTHKCKTCGVSYVDTEIQATGHTWSSWKTASEATETSVGIKEKTCVSCKAKQTVEIPKLAHTHKYTDTVTKPTCTADGYTTYKCSCGYSFVDTKISATGHAWGSWVVVEEATESSTGSKERTCSFCKTKDTAATPKLTHSHNYTSVVTKPSCSAEGYTTYTCSSCGNAYVDNITSATGHSYTHTVTKPTCTSEGYTTHMCSICKSSYVDTTIAAVGHIWGDWVTATAPTESATGLAKRYCNTCGDYVTKTLDRLSHAHSFNITIDYKAATCQSEGYNKKACSCGETKTETLPQTHNWGHKHTDEVGHYDVRIVCHCGWSCSADIDYISAFAAHVDGIDIETRYDHSYYDTAKWVVDIPAKDWEECSVCGTTK